MPEVDVTDQYIRLRQSDPEQFDDFRTIDIDKSAGIKAVLGIRKGGGSEVQSYLFDKDKWTVDRAQAWVRDHKEGVHATLKESAACPKCGWNMKYDDGKDAYVCEKCGYSKPNGPADDEEEEEESVNIGRLVMEERRGNTLRLC